MSRPTYSIEQIHQVYDRIQLPHEWRLEPEHAKTIARNETGLAFLTVLQRFTLANIPFENLELHYSRTKTIDIHPEILFQKIVTQGTGRGGYCMENNSFFATVLRSLGFEIMSTGGRVNAAAGLSGDVGDSPMYFGFAHMINIITIQGMRYMVDVGFGAGGATKPLPLEDGKIHLNIKHSQSVRLRFDSIPENESSTKLWIFERRIADDVPFAPCYCFPDNVEFLPGDYVAMNYFTSTNRMVFFMHLVLVVKMILSEDGEDIVGETVVMGNRVHRRITGEKENLGILESDDQRVAALEQYMEIRLDDMQRSGILGLESAIG